MKKGYSLLQVIIIIILTSIISGLTIGVIISKSYSNSGKVNYATLLKDKNVKDFLDVYASLSTDYYQEVDKSKMIASAIEGMTTYLDESYTTYLDKDATDDLFNKLDGTYNGIGIVVKNKTVVNVITNSPAEKVGIQFNDEIVAVNDTEVSNMSSNEVVSLIQQNNDTNIKLTIKRNGELIDFNVGLSELAVPNSEYYYLDDTQLGYLRISVFGKKVSQEVKSALDYFNNNEKGLIIDLRNNTGGYLEQAYETASLFLEKGKTIYYLKDKSDKNKYYDKTKEKYNKPIIILINNQTASAAEILTAALRDNEIAKIVGEKSYGKGKVQHTYNMNNGGLIKYTSSKWLTPSGSCIDQIGIIPDYNVKLEYIYDENDKTKIVDIIDKQLDMAKELLNI